MRLLGGGDRAAVRPWVRGALRCGVLLAAVSLGVLPAGTSAWAAQGTASGNTAATLSQAEQTLKPILDQLHTLYQQAEQETEKFDALSAQLTQAQSNVTQLDTQLAAAQARVDAGTEVAGQIAAAQYAEGPSDLTKLGELLFAQDPHQALHADELLALAGHSQAAYVKQLQLDRADLVGARGAAQAAQQQVNTLVAAESKQRDSVNKQLAQVEALVTSLTGAQRQELSLLEQKEANASQAALLASGLLGKGDLRPSAAGAKAVAYAFAQLGKPYVWGAEGPDSFDCSGLTSQAWLHAGVTIPRTSEMQWAHLTRVPLNALRPGDLIVYFQGASHVAIYIGGGLVIQAPHPGAYVDVAPIAQNPILGAVRPDPDSPSLGSYKPPAIPKGSQGPEPITPVPVPVTDPVTAAPTTTPTSKPTTKSSGSPSASPTATATATATAGPSGSASSSPSASSSGSASPSASPSASGSASASAEASGSASASASSSPSGSALG